MTSVGDSQIDFMELNGMESVLRSCRKKVLPITVHSIQWCFGEGPRETRFVCLFVNLESLGITGCTGSRRGCNVMVFQDSVKVGGLK